MTFGGGNDTDPGAEEGAGFTMPRRLGDHAVDLLATSLSTRPRKIVSRLALLQDCRGTIRCPRV